MHTKSYIVASDIDVYTKSYIVPNNGWGQEGNKLKDSKDQAYDRHTGPLPHCLFKKLKKKKSKHNAVCHCSWLFNIAIIYPVLKMKCFSKAPVLYDEAIYEKCL